LSFFWIKVAGTLKPYASGQNLITAEMRKKFPPVVSGCTVAQAGALPLLNTLAAARCLLPGHPQARLLDLVGQRGDSFGRSCARRGKAALPPHSAFLRLPVLASGPCCRALRTLCNFAGDWKLGLGRYTPTPARAHAFKEFSVNSLPPSWA